MDGQYRPWDPQATQAEETAPSEAPAEDYKPWAPGEQAPRKDAAPEPAPEQLAHAPGLGEAPKPKRSMRARQVASAMTLWTGGMFLLTAVIGGILFGAIADFEQYVDHDRGEAEDIRFYSGLVFWTLGIIGTGITAAGLGHLYGKDWGKGAVIAASIIGLLVNLIPSIVALSNLGGEE